MCYNHIKKRALVVFMKKIINISLYKNKRLELEENNIAALYNDEKYTFIMNDVKTSISQDYFTRETQEYLFTLDIQNKKCSYLLKEKNMTFDIEVEKAIYERRRRTTKLVYKISSDEEEFEVKIEELEGELNE